MGKREAILGSKLAREWVATPEWEGVDGVWVREMTALERDGWELVISEEKKKGAAASPNIRASAIVRCVVEESGERIFTDADAAELAAKGSGVLDRLFDVISRLSGLSEKARQEAKKNSPSGPPGSSPTASP